MRGYFRVRMVGEKRANLTSQHTRSPESSGQSRELHTVSPTSSKDRRLFLALKVATDFDQQRLDEVSRESVFQFATGRILSVVD